MKKYLSIGEISKISGVGVKSLRYYDEIGILKPIYINPDTKYRYYDFKQVNILDIIQICIELDIPLKKLENYKSENEGFDLNKLITDGKLIAQQKINKINASIKKLDTAQEAINIFNKVKGKQGTFNRYFNQRHLMFLPCEINEINNEYVYFKYTTELYKKAKEKNVNALAFFGYLVKSRINRLETFIFIEVDRPIKDYEYFISIPQGNYYCNICPKDDLFNMKYNSSQILVCTQLFDDTFKRNPSYMEIQIFRK